MPYFNHRKMENDTVTDTDNTIHEEEQLPPGVEIGYDNLGKIFYMDYNNRTISKDRPHFLPLGWEARKTIEGLIYYVNLKTQIITWQK